jgi:hypothetical protein
MLNSALAEMVARDRIAEMHRTAARRSFDSRGYRAMDETKAPTVQLSVRRAHRPNPRRAVGWFLVSVGLRLALPRPRAGSTR